MTEHTDNLQTQYAALVRRCHALEVENQTLAQTRAALQQRETQLETTIEHLTEGLVVSTIEGEWLRWNRAALAMHGFASLQEARRRLPDFASIFELATLDGQVLPLDDWPLARILRGEELHDWEIRIRRLQRDWQRIFSYGGTLVRDAQGQPILALVTINDITARKRDEQERERLLAELQGLTATLEQRVRERTAALEATNKELEAFSFSVSHDLRAPLRSIDGFSRILGDRYADQLGAEGRDYLARVRAAARRMGRLIDDMLKLSRIGRAEMTRAALNLYTLAEAVIAELRVRDPDRRVAVAIAPSLPVDGDPGLLRIVMENLLGNAWKFTAHTAEARIEVGTCRRGAETVYFVRDNGAGFEMSYADKLFTPFQRLHSEEEFPGTGIGLAIVQRIIARHGGRVWAEGEVERGATIYFTLGGTA